ncbi:MAG: hypothetical protein GXP03_00785, partial [Alphaproteobacteria bacterium]|nr:hypothetical protein [Alphaproteobacteria bacterium]
MGLIPREYYTLNEALGDWNITESELQYIVETGQLNLSVRIYGAFSKCNGKKGAVQHNSDLEGVVDLRRRDALKVLRSNTCPVPTFISPDGGRVSTPNGGNDWIVYRDTLVVRKSERDRFQEIINRAKIPHINDYERFLSFTLDGKSYFFTDMQARALNFLYICAVTGEPDQRGLDVLDAAGSVSTKLSYLFSSRPGWRDLVLSMRGRRGYYL